MMAQSQRQEWYQLSNKLITTSYLFSDGFITTEASTDIASIDTIIISEITIGILNPK